MTAAISRGIHTRGKSQKQGRPSQHTRKAPRGNEKAVGSAVLVMETIPRALAEAPESPGRKLEEPLG